MDNVLKEASTKDTSLNWNISITDNFYRAHNKRGDLPFSVVIKPHLNIQSKMSYSAFRPETSWTAIITT